MNRLTLYPFNMQASERNIWLCRTNAYSLPELIVVMIISGIIIFIVANGFLSLKKVVINTNVSITSSTDSILEYYRNHMYTIVGGKVVDADSMLRVDRDSLFATFIDNEIVYIKQLVNKNEDDNSVQKIIR